MRTLLRLKKFLSIDNFLSKQPNPLIWDLLLICSRSTDNWLFVPWRWGLSHLNKLYVTSLWHLLNATVVFLKYNPPPPEIKSCVKVNQTWSTQWPTLIYSRQISRNLKKVFTAWWIMGWSAEGRINRLLPEKQTLSKIEVLPPPNPPPPVCASLEHKQVPRLNLDISATHC